MVWLFFDQWYNNLELLNLHDIGLLRAPPVGPFGYGDGDRFPGLPG